MEKSVPELAFYLVVLEHPQKPKPPLWEEIQWESDDLGVLH